MGSPPLRLSRDASAKNEAAAEAMGVEQVAVPNHNTKSAERKRHQKQRWFRKGQKWRVGCEGRISVLKRRHGMDRSLYKGDDGMKAEWEPSKYHDDYRDDVKAMIARKIKTGKVTAVE